MKYLVIGAGGTGGPIGADLAKGGKDVTLIARGAHLATMQQSGLRMEGLTTGDYTVYPIKATDMEHYDESPDVIFVCVKGYSLDSTVSFIKKVSTPDTIVVPILNIFGTGEKLQEQLPELLVTDGCIYISGEIKEPACILRKGDIFRIVFGARNPEEYRPEFEQIKADLEACGIKTVLSDNIKRDAFRKFSYVSPAAACGQYYGIAAGPMQHPGKERDTYISLVKEIDALANAMGIPFDVDIVEKDLDILDHVSPEATASMQRDMEQGRSSEVDGLVYEVVRMGERYGVPTPTYKMIADELSARESKE